MEEKSERDQYDFSSVFVAVFFGMVLWYLVNFLASRPNVTLSLGQPFDSEAAGVLLGILVIAALVVLFLLLPVLLARALIEHSTGRRLLFYRVFFIMFSSLLLAAAPLALLSAALGLDSLAQDSDSPGLEAVSVVFYYLVASLLASFWLWKRPGDDRQE